MDPLPSAAVAGMAGWWGAQEDRWGEASGYPDPFTLVVVSGDDGPLAAAVLSSEPKCATALRYVVVNPDVAGRTEPPARLVQLVSLEDPVFLFPSRARGGGGGAEFADLAQLDDLDDVDDLDDPTERPPARGIGPLATFLTDVPALGEVEGAVVAIGVLSRLPFDLYEWDGGWSELRVSAEDGVLREMTLPVGDETTGLPAAVVAGPAAAAAGADVAGPAAAVAAAAAPAAAAAAPVRWARQTGAADWLRRVVPSAKAAYLAVVDDWGSPLGPSLDLDQLTPVREPLDAHPAPIDGTPYAAVTWRLR